MALIDPNTRAKVDIPDEPGQWVELRPLAAADYAFVQRNAIDKSAAEISIELLSRAITSWSYPAEVSVENLGRLDIVTFQWLRDEMQVVTDQRSPDQKNASTFNSSPTSDTAESSPPSLDT